MSKKKLPNVRSKKLPPAMLLAPEVFLPTDDMTFEVSKLDEIAGLLWLPDSLEEKERNARILRALELYEDLKPEGSAEGMLAEQMVGTHSAALECLRQAAIENQTVQGRDMALKHAQKLMTLYTQQLAALNKNRGKGQQKVTVEHVNVEPGGQAIVGNVEAGQSGNQNGDSTQDLEQPYEAPMPPPKSKRKAKNKRSG